MALPPAPDAIELRHLRAFIAVAEELNFGRAATRLYLSQPALSRQIRALERLLGCDLLRRSTHRVELTLAGDALLERARQILRDVDDAVSVTRSVGGELATRIRRVWEDAVGDTRADSDLTALREVTEALHGRFAPPAEIAIRPVNTGGVSSLLLSPEPQAPTSLLYLHGGGNVSGSAFGYRHLSAPLPWRPGAGRFCRTTGWRRNTPSRLSSTTRCGRTCGWPTEQPTLAASAWWVTRPAPGW
jgi:DNA-binding transcriptional LysR family regulator